MGLSSGKRATCAHHYADPTAWFFFVKVIAKGYDKDGDGVADRGCPLKYIVYSGAGANFARPQIGATGQSNNDLRPFRLYGHCINYLQ